MNCVKH